MKAQHFCDPAEMGFQYLTHVHSTRDTERIQKYVKGPAVFEERHVLFGHYLCDNALVAVPSGHLVANRQCPLDSDVDFYHLQYAAGQFIAVLETSNPAFSLLLHLINLGPELIDDFLCIVPQCSGFDPLDTEVLYLLVNDFIIIAGSDLLQGGRIDNLDLEFRMEGLDHLPENGALLGPGFRLQFLYPVCGRLLLFVRAGSTPGEPFGLYHDSLVSTRQFERIIFDIFAGSAKYRMQQLFFRCQFRFALGHDLADQNIAWTDPCPFANHPMLIKVAKRPLADIGNVAGKLFFAETRLANFGSEFIDVDARKAVILTEPLADDNRILEVETVERNESHEKVLAQREHAVVSAPAVGDDLPFFDLLAKLNGRILIKTGSLVQTDVLGQLIFIGLVDDNPGRINLGDDATALGADNHA